MAKTHLFYGRNVLVEALAERIRIREIYYSNDQSKKWIEGLKTGIVPCRGQIPSELRSVAHQGIAFRADYEFYLDQWDIKRNSYPFVVLCNHLEDVQNLGSLSRAAAAFGVGLIIHEERRSARMNEVAVKVSAGQAFRLRYLEVSNLTPLCRKLTEAGYLIVGLDASSDSSMNLFDWEPSFPLALVIGSEAEGLSKPVKSQLHSSIKIPMADGVESLNATQASTIAMSWVFRNFSK